MLRRIFLLPVTAIRWLGHLFARIFGRVLAPVSGRIDSSDGLSDFLNRFSSSMATQRGLLLMVGTGLVVVSLVTHAVVMLLLVLSDSFDRNLYWLCLPIAVLHLGILIGFTGVMLATPLGQGYRDDK